jgi:hypothetical protein
MSEIEAIRTWLDYKYYFFSKNRRIEELFDKIATYFLLIVWEDAL